MKATPGKRSSDPGWSSAPASPLARYWRNASRRHKHSGRRPIRTGPLAVSGLWVGSATGSVTARAWNGGIARIYDQSVPRLFRVCSRPVPMPRPARYGADSCRSHCSVLSVVLCTNKRTIGANKTITQNRGTVGTKPRLNGLEVERSRNPTWNSSVRRGVPPTHSGRA